MELDVGTTDADRRVLTDARHSKMLRIVLLVSLVWLVADNLLEFAFPSYLEGSGKSYALIGFLLALPPFMGLLVDLPLGRLSDTVSRKRLMVYGLLVSIVASVLLFQFRSNVALVVVFLVWGFGYQLWKVPRDAQFAALTEHGRRGRAYGWDTFVKYVGFSLGPLAAGIILQFMGYRGIVVAYLTLLVLAVVLLVVFFRERLIDSRRPEDRIPVSTIASFLKVLSTLGSTGIVLLLISLLLTAWEQILWTFEPLFYGRDFLNIPAHLGGLLLACFSLPGIVLAYPAGVLADRHGKLTLLVSGLMVMAIGLVAFSISRSLAVVFSSAMVVSVGWTVVFPALGGLIVDLSRSHPRGALAGAWDFSMDLGFMIGPLLGGVVASTFGLTAVFLSIGLLFLAATGLLLGVKKISRYERGQG